MSKRQEAPVSRAAVVGAALALVVVAASPLEAQTDNSIQLVVTGLDNGLGHVHCALENEGTWLTKTPARVSTGPIQGNQATCEFRDVLPGVYALVAFHDENDNLRLDVNFLGIPVEQYCTSRDAQRPRERPRFENASFNYTGGRQVFHSQMLPMR
jgi:uncharacterized protein (DUF2141 family)